MKSKLYRRPQSRLWQISFMTWNEERGEMVRKRVSSGTENEEEARALADGLESAAKSARPLSGSTITKKHAHGLFLNLLSTAGIFIEGDTKLPSLRSFVASYLEGRKGKVTESTLVRYGIYERKFEAWLTTQAPNLDPPLDWLTIDRAGDYYDFIAEILAVKTAKETFNFLKRAMGRAVQTTDLLKNPCDSIEPDTRGETLDRLPFELDEAKKLITWLLGQGEREREWARCAALSLMSGCRIDDAITMDQSAISDGVLSYKQGKGGKEITCPLVVPSWREAILETSTGPVSPKLHKELTQWGNGDLSTEFTKFVEKAGIEQKYKTFKSGRRIARKTFHSLRHTLRTAIVSSGGSDAQADVILGHSEGEGKRYTHSEVEGMRGTLKRALDQE